MAKKPADLSATKGNRIGCTMLFHQHVGKDDFEPDKAVYDELYDIGFRAFEVQVSNKSDAWLRGLKQWADECVEETHLHTIDFFVNVGDEPACPVGAKGGSIERAKIVFESHLAKAAICGSRSHFGPYSAGLLAGYYEWTLEHDARCIDFLRWANGIAANANMPTEFETLNRFETGVSTLEHMQRLFTLANTGEFIVHGPDTFHQSMGEVSTVDAWKRHNGKFGKTGHLSDSGRTVIGAEQALTTTNVFPYLASGLCSVKTWNIEAFGSDTHPGIAAALCVRRLPQVSGIKVMRQSFQRVVAEFGKC